MSNNFDTAVLLDSATYVAGDATTSGAGYFGFGRATGTEYSSGARILTGTAVPSETAPIGSIYLRAGGNGQLYINTDSGTTWTQIGSISSGSIELTDNSANAFEFVQAGTPYLRFVTTNGAERNRSDVSWDFGSTAQLSIDFDIADNTAAALEVRAGSGGVIMLGFETTNGAEVLSTAAPTIGLTAAAGTQLRLTDNIAAGLSIGASGALSMMTFVTTNGAETIVVAAAGGERYNDSIPLRFGTPGTDVVMTPDGTDLLVTGTGAIEYGDDFEQRFGADADGALEYISASNTLSLRSNTVSAATALVGSSLISVASGGTITSTAVAGVGSGSVTIGSGNTDVTDAGGSSTGSGAVVIVSGSASSTAGASSGPSGAITLSTGNSTDGASGDVVLTTGTAGTTRGVLDINVATVDLSTQATDIELIDNSSTALTISQGSTVYIGVLTSNAAEAVNISVPAPQASTLAPALRTAAAYSSRWQVVEDFSLRPQLVASIANNDASKLTALIGTNSADAGSVFATTGGITLTTTGAANDQMCVRSQTTANQGALRSTTWSTSDQLVYRAVINVIDTTNVVIAAGLKLSLTAGATLFDNATDANQIYFGYATDDRYGVGAANWAAVVRIGGASANVNLGAIATGRTFLTIAMGSDRVTRFYLNGALVATTAAVTAGVSLLPFVGTETLAAAGKQLGVSYLAMEKVYS